METLYQNNWLNADKTIKTIGRKSAAVRNHLADSDVIVNPNSTRRTDEQRHSDRKYFSQSSGSNASSSAPPSSSDDENRRTSISSLGRYQLTLEQMQKLDLNQSNELFRKTMRNLNGYKPSTIRQKHRRNYAGWDEFKEKATDDDEEIRRNQNAHRSSPSNENLKYYQAFDSNGSSKKVILIPKIKRSQTMRVTSTAFPSLQSPSSPPSPSSPLSAMNGNGSKTLNGTTTINLRNVFNRQHSQEQQQQPQQPRMPTATINKNFNRFKRNNLPIIRNGINNNDGNDHDDDYDDVDDGEDSVPNRNGHGSSDRNGRSFAATQNGYRTTECIIPSNFSQFTMKSNGCIKNDKQKPNGTCDNELKVNGAPTATTKKKTLLRAKSVRINPTPLQDIYYDRMMADRRESNGGNQSQKTTTNGTSTTNCDKRSINNNTNNSNGNNGTSGRLTLRQKLPRLTSIMKKKPIVITEELPSRSPEHKQQQPLPALPADGKPILDQWINFHYKKSKDQQSQPPQQRPQFDNNNGKAVPNKPKSDKNSSTSSLSSMSSGCADCNSNVSDFSIPRPRLIVPVHTYARKRRTGNLIQVNQSSAGAGDYVDRFDANNAVIIKQPRNSSNTNNNNNNKHNNGKRENKALPSNGDKFLLLLFWFIGI